MSFVEDVEDVEVENLFIPSIEPIPISIDTQSFSNIDSKNNFELDNDIDKKTEMNTAINSKTINPISNILNTDENNVDIKLEDITDLNLDNDSENIILDIEDLSVETTIKEDPNILKEFDLSSSLENNLESITLKKPNQVYYEIYKKAREKAKEAKKEAILAFLEAKNIKKTYMLDDIDESESENESDAEDLNFDEIEDI